MNPSATSTRPSGKNATSCGPRGASRRRRGRSSRPGSPAARCRRSRTRRSGGPTLCTTHTRRSGVVGADADAVRPRPVRPLEQVVPLVPDLDDVAVAVDDVDAVLKRPALGLAQGVDADGAGVAVEPVRHRVGKPRLAPLQDEDAVGRLHEDAGVAAEGEALARERLEPALDRLVGDGLARPQQVLGRGGAREDAAHCDDQQNSNDVAHDHALSTVVTVPIAGPEVAAPRIRRRHGRPAGLRHHSAAQTPTGGPSLLRSPARKQALPVNRTF